MLCVELRCAVESVLEETEGFDSWKGRMVRGLVSMEHAVIALLLSCALSLLSGDLYCERGESGLRLYV
jgi:hypothetical protein